MQRIVIIGCSGSGKSTLARELGRRLGLPVIHLDALYWHPGWQEPADRAAFDANVVRITESECWIIDGGYSTTLASRLARADTLIVMNLAVWLCLWRAIWRVVKYRGRTRPDMGPGCPEKIDLKFLGYTWTYRRKVLPRYEEQFIRQFRGRIVRLGKPAETRGFLASVAESGSVRA